MKSKPIIIILITLILIGTICFLLIRPVATSIWQAWTGLEKARADLKNVEEKKKILEALKNNPELSSVGEIALKYIPKESESGELVVEVAAIAQSNNLKVEEISMEQSKETKKTEEETTTPTPKTNQSTPSQTISPKTTNIKEVDFSMKVSGTFSDLINFLRGVESSSRLIAIKNLALQMPTSTSSNPTQNLSSQMTGAAYYKSEVALEENLKNIQVSQETIDKFLNLKTFGSPINLPTESGFGRNNPFENY